ncbi:hypothetical protein ES703_38382 [subsurface metagenome]
MTREIDVVVGMAVGVKLVTLLGRAAMVGSTRGVMVGLIVGVRGAMLTVGERIIIACADACGMSSQVKGAQTAISAIAAQPAFNRLLNPSAIMKPRPYGADSARLTIFSPRSLLIRLATSSLLIDLPPNCRRNRPLAPPTTVA